MHRIDGDGAVPNQNGAGKTGFNDAYPNRTMVTDDWANDVQENISEPIERMGIALSKGDFSQLFNAINRMIVAQGARNWTTRPTAGAIVTDLEGVASDGAGTVVLVSNATDIQSSSNGGLTWTARTPSGSVTGFAAVAYGGGKFVAIAAGTNKVQTSPDGATWTAQAIGAISTPFGLAWSGALWLSTWTSGVLYTSPDGVTWTLRTGVNATAAMAGWGNGLFITGGGSGLLQSSPDGIVWTARTAAAAYVGTWRGHAYGAGLHVIVGDTGEIQTSPDGITWTRRTTGVTASIRSVAYGAGTFVAPTDSNSYVLVSNDGITWTKAFLPDTGDDAEAVCFDGQGFVVVGEDGVVYTSLKGSVA